MLSLHKLLEEANGDDSDAARQHGMLIYSARYYLHVMSFNCLSNYFNFSYFPDTEASLQSNALQEDDIQALDSNSTRQSGMIRGSFVMRDIYTSYLYNRVYTSWKLILSWVIIVQ